MSKDDPVDWLSHRDYIVEQIAMRRSLKEIGLDFGVTSSRMTVVVRKLGLDVFEIKNSTWSNPENLRKLVFDDGLCKSDIAAMLKISLKVLQVYLDRYEIDPRDPAVYFASRCRETGNELGCIEWTGSRMPDNGYGRAHVNGEPGYAHRLAYQLHKGEIPDGMFIDHVCCNKWCVNPDHLEVVTNSENLSRFHERWKAGFQYDKWKMKTHCKHGHEYTKENTYTYKNKKGTYDRQCRKCISDRGKKRNVRTYV